MQGVGYETKEAQPFTQAEEELLKESDMLSAENAKGLLRAVFFSKWKNFCLLEGGGGGGGEEHWQLKLSQLKKFTDPLRYAYIENTSKNHSGILAQMRVKNKAVLIVAVPEVGTRCHVHVLDLYIQKLFQAAFTHDNFYVQPCSTVPDDSSKPWFTVNPIGKNSLSKMVKEVCSEEGISGRKITHSLHASDRCNKPVSSWCSRKFNTGKNWTFVG